MNDLYSLKWGTAHDSRQYGLYDMITNRIVITYHEPHILEFVSNLFSSRVDLKLVNLSTAENFTNNLIDNTCCMNWTVSNHIELTSIRSGLRINSKIAKAKKLIKSDTTIDFSLLEDTSPYLQYCLATVVWFDDNIKNLISEYTGIQELTYKDYDYLFQNIFLELPFQGNQSSQLGSLTKMIRDRKKVFNIIYNEFDFDIAQIKCNEIINQY